MLRTTMCALCKHSRPIPEGGWRPSCEAFPDGIPEDILQNTVGHDDPFPGDKGIRYEPLPQFEKTHPTFRRAERSR